ncbi:putative amidohydrolase [Sinorhizobium medicae]
MMFKAAAVQMCSGVDPARNAETMAELVREAALRGAGYVQTPEMTGAIQRDRSGLRSILRDEANDIVVRKAARLAGELAIYLHVGSTPIALADGKIANRGFLFGPDGAKICEYDKIHMFDVDLENGESWRESAAYHPGATARIADLPFGKLGFFDLLRCPLPRTFPTAGGGRGRDHVGARGVYTPDRRGALGDTPAGSRN